MPVLVEVGIATLCGGQIFAAQFSGRDFALRQCVAIDDTVSAVEGEIATVIFMATSCAPVERNPGDLRSQDLPRFL